MEGIQHITNSNSTTANFVDEDEENQTEEEDSDDKEVTQGKETPQIGDEAYNHSGDVNYQKQTEEPHYRYQDNVNWEGIEGNQYVRDNEPKLKTNEENVHNRKLTFNKHGDG